MSPSFARNIVAQKTQQPASICATSSKGKNMDHKYLSGQGVKTTEHLKQHGKQNHKFTSFKLK